MFESWLLKNWSVELITKPLMFASHHHDKNHYLCVCTLMNVRDWLGFQPVCTCTQHISHILYDFIPTGFFSNRSIHAHLHWVELNYRFLLQMSMLHVIVSIHIFDLVMEHFHRKLQRKRKSILSIELPWNLVFALPCYLHRACQRGCHLSCAVHIFCNVWNVYRSVLLLYTHIGCVLLDVVRQYQAILLWQLIKIHFSCDY